MPSCSVCNKSIQQWLEDSNGRKFCSEECFQETLPKCHACGKSLNQWIENEKGMKFCSENCARTAWPKCATCGQPMNQWIEIEGKCFCSEACTMAVMPKCEACSKPMNEWVAAEDGRKFCSEKCFSTTWPKCEICGKSMQEWTTDEQGRKFCSDACFKQTWPVCEKCNTSMDQWLYTEDGQKYCSEECLSSTWPKCDVCGQPMRQWSETEDGNKYCSYACAETVLPTCECCGNPMAKWLETDLGRFCSDLCARTEKKCRDILASPEVAGLSYGAANAAMNYEENIILGASKGHGFAAEKSNHLIDRLSGKDAKLVGGDNAKNGADRLVDGLEIQTKYCRTGSKCIEECFSEGKFRYQKSDGTPMLIEVPADKYDDAVKAMQNRISKGEIPGVSDPQMASDIVKKGSVSYEQARNIAKFGTIESISYDCVNGAIVAGSAMGISAVFSLASSVWNGEDWESALKSACYSGLKVGGVVWVTNVISAQLGRTAFEKSLKSGTDLIVKSVGSKTASLIATSLRNSGSGIYGAAAVNNVSKLLRGTVVAGVVTTVVLSAADIGRMFDGRLSGAQLFKNVSVNAAGVAGGTGGYVGALWAVTTAFGPVGWVTGAIVGGVGALMAGSVSSKVTKSVLDEFIEDDANAMFTLFQKSLEDLAFSFLLNEEEIDRVSASINQMDMANAMRDMYASSNRKAYATSIIKPLLVEEAAQRQRIQIPDNDELFRSTELLLVSGA